MSRKVSKVVMRFQTDTIPTVAFGYWIRGWEPPVGDA